jgi:hypothetical protein
MTLPHRHINEALPHRNISMAGAPVQKKCVNMALPYRDINIAPPYRSIILTRRYRTGMLIRCYRTGILTWRYRTGILNLYCFMIPYGNISKALPHRGVNMALLLYRHINKALSHRDINMALPHWNINTGWFSHKCQWGDSHFPNERVRITLWHCSPHAAVSFLQPPHGGCRSGPRDGRCVNFKF